MSQYEMNIYCIYLLNASYWSCANNSSMNVFNLTFFLDCNIFYQNIPWANNRLLIQICLHPNTNRQVKPLHLFVFFDNPFHVDVRHNTKEKISKDQQVCFQTATILIMNKKMHSIPVIGRIFILNSKHCSSLFLLLLQSILSTHQVLPCLMNANTAVDVAFTFDSRRVNRFVVTTVLKCMEETFVGC